MTDSDNRTVSLRREDAAIVDELVSSGAYRSEEDVVSAGISALLDHEADFAEWLRKEVVPACEEMATHPDGAVSIEDAFATVREHHEERLRTKR